MRSVVPWTLTFVLLAAALPLTAGTASACVSPPCGYIFPLITLEPEGGSIVRDLPKSGDVVVPVKLTFSFDASNEGYSVTRPDDKITVTFEFPRKPVWANMSVEPDAIDIPVNDPTYLKVDSADAQNPKVHFEYTTTFTLTLRQVPGGQPVLKDGLETARLLLYAKSNEAKTGLYKAAYAIKEFKVIPEGAVHESDLAPSEGGPVVVDYRATPVQELTRAAGAVTFTFKPGVSEVAPWSVMPFTLTAKVNDKEGPVTLAYSLVDASGTVAYSSGPRHAAAGTLPGTVTFPGVGLHHLLVYAEAAPGNVNPAPSFAAFPIDLEPSEGADLVAMPMKYKASYQEVVSEVSGRPDAMQQYVKWIPFRVEEGATAAQVDVSLDTRGVPVSPATGLANLYFQVLNPDGGELGQKSVDVANSKQTVRVQALPGAGVYHVKVFGFGAGAAALAGAVYSVDIATGYENPPVAVLARDEPTVARFGDTTFAFNEPAEGWQPWAPTPVSLNASRLDGSVVSLKGARVSLGVLSGAGEFVYGSTPRAVSGDASPDVSMTFQHAGPGFLVAYVAPQTAGGIALQGTPILLPVTVGATDAAEFVYPTTLLLEYEDIVPTGTSPATPFTIVYPYRVLAPGATGGESRISISGAGPASWKVLDSEGNDLGQVPPTEPGDYRIVITTSGPAGQSISMDLDQEYPSAPSEANPLSKPPVPEVVDAGGLFGLPGVGLLGALAALGLAAAVVAGRRR